jgi:TonB family protein
MHFFLAVALPDFLGEDSGIIPIELLASRELLVEISAKNKGERSPGADQKAEKPVSSETPVDRTFLERKMEELSLGESLRAPAPDVLLPPIAEEKSREEKVRRILTSPFYKELAKAFEESLRPGKNYGGVGPTIETSVDILKEKRIEIDPATELVLVRLRATTEKKTQKEEKERKLGIKGPIARRELTYVPPIPKVKAPIETEFEMKFWVRPNGSVDRVIPLKRAGDVELERVATNYLRQWRFKAIPENELQVEEWGTIVIKFRLE